MALDARSLRYFAEVVGSGSISRAAATLGVSQPALSKCIRELEAQLNVQLLERSATGVAPTLYGRTLYLRATSVTAEISRAQAEIRELADSRPGLVRIGVLPSQVQLLPAASLRLLKSRPGIRLQVIERARGELLSGLLRSEFDLILSVILATHTPPNVTTQLLFHDRPSILVRTEHPSCRERTFKLRSLAQYPWIVPPIGSERWSDLENVLKLAGLDWPPKTVIECQSSLFLRTLVMKSDCVGLLPNDDQTEEEKAGLLRAVHLDQLPFKRAVGLLYRNDYPQPEAVLAVAREIGAVAASRQKPK